MDALSLARMVQPDPAAVAGMAARFRAGLPSATPVGELGSPLPALPSSPQVAGGNGVSFAETLNHLIQEVGQKQEVARGSVQGLMAGQNVPLHQAMIAMEEASVAFQLMVEVRNKLLESYQELMRMQV